MMLWVHQILARSRQDFLHLTKIAKISPWYLNLSKSQKDFPRSCRDFERSKHLTEIAYISLRSPRDLERIRISPRSCQNCKYLTEISPKLWTSPESGAIVENSYNPRSFSEVLHWNIMLCGSPLAVHFSVRFQIREAQKWNKTFQHGLVLFTNFLFNKVEWSNLLFYGDEETRANRFFRWEFCWSSWNFGLSLSHYQQDYLWVTQ